MSFLWTVFARMRALRRSAHADRDLDEVGILEVRDLAPMSEDFCGGGFLYESRVRSLADLAPAIGRRHQTLAVHGIGAADARDLAVAVNGRGIDRIVPIGQALQFNRQWDGYDLFAEFTRQVTIDVDDTGRGER